MVLEKEGQKLPEKFVSENNVDVDSEGSGELQKMHSFDVDPMKKNQDGEGGKKIFKASTKKKMQLTFEHIVIKTIP
jgi:hypothetical protein